MKKFWRRTYIDDPSLPHHVNISNRNIHNGQEDVDEFFHNVREGHKAKGEPVHTPGQGNGRGAGTAAKIIGVGFGLLVVGGLVMQGVEKVKEGYNEADAWLHNKADPSRTRGEAAPKAATGTSRAAKKPAEPAKKAPAQASVYKQLPQGTIILPQRDYIGEVTSDAIGYAMEKSGSKWINTFSLNGLIEDSAKAASRPFTQGMTDFNGETLEVMMGKFNGAGRHAVLCLGSADGIRSLSHMHIAATPENMTVTFSNSVTSSTGQKINLTEIANRAGQCHQVMIALKKIDPNLRFALD